MDSHETWTENEVAALWGWTLPAPADEVVPYDERCWRCDSKRIHRGCAAGLCEACCSELKAVSAA